MENHYYDENGVYIGSAPAHDGTAAPANALRTAPDERAGFWPVVNASRDGWELAEDHRGARGWLAGVAVVVTALGPLPEGWTGEPPEESPAGGLLFVNRTGVCHASGCGYARGHGKWMSPAEAFALGRKIRPCGVCRPALGKISELGIKQE